MNLSNNTILQGGKYKIVRFISSGGFGCTYEGLHVMLDKRVAIKEFFVKDFCNRDETTLQVSVGAASKHDLVNKLRKKFNEEARAVFGMKHENIARVIDIFEENGTAYYVMEFIDGKSLQDIVKERGKLPEKEALGYIRQIAMALRYVHSLNRLHLDIKPANIMVDKTGHAILVDFGASKHYDEESGENSSTLMGVNTKGYAPLEQMNTSFTKFSPATDIYALGATLYKLLTGVTPPDSCLLVSELESLEPLPSTISLATRQAVKAAMEIKAKNRPQTIDEFIAILNGDEETSFDGDEDTTIDNDGNREEKKDDNNTREKDDNNKKETNGHNDSPERKNPIVIILAVLLAAAIGSIIYLMSGRGNKPTIPEQQQPDSAKVESTVEDDADDKYSESVDEIEKDDYVPVADYDDIDRSPIERIVIDAGGCRFALVKVIGARGGDFYIGETEVTQRQWESIMGYNPSVTKGSNLPVGSVSWEECCDFVYSLSEVSGYDFRLPSSYQWQFAASGGTRSHGFIYAGSDNLMEVSWGKCMRPHDVGGKKPNELGIYDMSGNVWEWCDDVTGHGGSCNFDEKYHRITFVSPGRRDQRGPELGLRVVMIP